MSDTPAPAWPEPIDPDVDLHVPAQRRELRRAPWSVLAAVSAGGTLGALARYAATVAWPHAPGGFPWATFAVNVSGCLLIGVLMVLVTEVWTTHELVRPFLGTGVLGGYTTFSTYSVDGQQLLAAGSAGTALPYLAGTLVTALVAVAAGLGLTRAVARRSAVVDR
jgi:fluoride exporter